MKPNGYKLYIIRTIDGGIYLVGNASNYKGVNYYGEHYAGIGDFVDEDIAEWVGVDESIFNKNENKQNEAL